MGAWTGEVAGQTVLVVAIMSIIPLLLVVLDFFSLSGAVIDIQGVKLDFSKVQQQGRAGAGAQGFELPENIGVPGAIVTDSAPMSIQRTLNIGEKHGIVVVNVKSGNSWWVTRLLVLCAGAVRTGAPQVLVFLGKKENTPDYYLGYGKPADLLKAILNDKPGYRARYDKAMDVTKQFLAYKEIKDLVTTPNLIMPPNIVRYATNPQYLGQDEGVTEQILLDQMGNLFFDPAKPGSLEDPPDRITISRLNELFDSCLYRDCIDLDATNEEQLKQLFAAKGEYVGLLRKSVYSSLLKKKDGEELILRQLAMPTEARTSI